MPLLWLSLAFLTGILIGDNLPWNRIAWFVMSGISFAWVVISIVFRVSILNLIPERFSQWLRHLWPDQPVYLPRPQLILFFICLGGLRYQASVANLLNPHFIAARNDTGEVIVLQAILIKPVDRADQFTHLMVRAEKLHPANDPGSILVDGRVQVSTESTGDWQYGDRLVIRGELVTPPESDEFSYRKYLEHQGVYASMSLAEVSLLEAGVAGNPLLRKIYALRDRAHRLIYQLWPDPEASLLAGILLGIESGISDPVYQAFRDTGTSHIIVISGFNITIVAGLFSVLFSRWLGRWWGAVAAGIGIAAYTLLVGADPAVVRAAIMGGLTLFGRQMGRRQDGLNTLTIVAALMALFNPHVLWDAGFQLSFMATLGLVLFADPISQSFVGFTSRWLPQEAAQRLSRPVGEYILFTLAAQATSLPLLIFLFQKLSLSSMLANPLILPVQPAVMVLGGLAVMAGLVHPILGQALAALAWPFVVYTIRVVELVAQLPGGALFLGKAGWVIIVLYYGLLLGWTWLDPLVRRVIGALRGEQTNTAVTRLMKPLPGLSLIGVMVFNVVFWREVSLRPDGKLHITLFQVSDKNQMGEAILIQSPTGRFVLINGGAGSTTLSENLGRRMPLLHRSLDFLVVGDPREGQIGALPVVIERFIPDNLLWSGPVAASRSARSLREKATAAGTTIIPASLGQSLELGGGASLRVLAAGRRGAVFCLEWDNFRALLPVGANFEELEALRWGGAVGPVTALLLADQGLASTNPPEWITNLDPQVILLSVSEGNWKGLPSPETLAAVYGRNLLRTNLNGWIQISTDGEQMWVEVERR